MKLRKSDRSAVVLAFVSVLCWSGAATAFKMALFYESPWLVVFSGSVISTVIFGFTLAVGRTRICRSDFLSGLYLGFLNPFLYYLVLLNAYNGLPAQIAMVVNYLWPVVLVLLSVPLLGQKLNVKGLAGILLSFAGVVFLALIGRNSFEIPTTPLLLAFASTFIWAVYWLLNTRNKGKTTAVLFTSFVFGSIYLLVYGIATGQEFSLHPGILPWIVYIGFLEMGFTYLMWNTALKWASSTATVSGMIFLTPFIALIFIGIVVGEKIAPSTVIGLMFVVGGILMEKYSRRRSS
ncbi:MAG: DMT family transporter [Candidatus Sabulitectum sp.]|nr:DMT family transporter [Candidatus Sabulitectum sp.]